MHVDDSIWYCSEESSGMILTQVTGFSHQNMETKGMNVIHISPSSLLLIIKNKLDKRFAAFFTDRLTLGA